MRPKGKWERNASLEPVQSEPFMSRHEHFQPGQQPPLHFCSPDFPFQFSFSLPSPAVGLHASYLTVVIPSAEKAGSRAIPIFFASTCPGPEKRRQCASPMPCSGADSASKIEAETENLASSPSQSLCLWCSVLKFGDSAYVYTWPGLGGPGDMVNLMKEVD